MRLSDAQLLSQPGTTDQAVLVTAALTPSVIHTEVAPGQPVRQLLSDCHRALTPVPASQTQQNRASHRRGNLEEIQGRAGIF